MRRLLAVLVLVLVGGAYLGGWLPERARRKAAEEELARVSARAEAAEGRLRLADLETRLLALVAAVEARNYGIATTKAARLFDGVRIESATLPGEQRALAERILSQRESITTALKDPDTMDLARVRLALDEMHETLKALRSAAR